jgi:flagellar FliL protein
MADDRAGAAENVEHPVRDEEEEERPARRFAFTFPIGRYLRVIVIGLVALIVAAVGAFLVVSRMTSAPAPPTSAGETVTRAPLANFGLEQFRTNLADRESTSYIQADIVLGYNSGLKSNAKLQDELKERENEIRDIVNLILNSKTSQELISVDGKEALKREIMDKINDILSKGRIEKIYLKNFVIQTL